MNKFIEISILIILVGLFIFSLFIMKEERESEGFKGFCIEVADGDSIAFVTPEIIENFLSTDSLKCYYQNYASGNVYQLEQQIGKLPFVKDVNVYSDITGQFSINIKQPDILMRIMSENSEDIYIDFDGNRIQTVGYFVTDVPVVTINSAKFKELIDFEKKVDKNGHFYNNLINFVKFVMGDDFWDNMIVQINLTINDEIELTPRVGNHKIILSKVSNFSNYKEQLGRLKGFYKSVVPMKGWSRYKKIDLQYNDIVIATR